jgi:glycosyltransferase involved in cell wall biosynthesis
MSPLVTIGIPCYNAAASLKTAIESALAQTHPNIEVIVVDDGSTDTSLIIASAFDERVNVIRASHRGSNYARNRIMKESRAEWIQYLDADDRLEPEKIARQLAEAGDCDEVDVIYSPVIVETTTGGKSSREISRTNPGRDLYAQWLAGELPQTGGCLWRRTALQDIDGWRVEQPCWQEHELYCRSLKARHRWKFASTPGAVYRIWSEETLCRKDPIRLIRVRTRLMDHLQEWMKVRKLWKPVHAQTAGRACLEMARTLARYDLADASRYHRDRRKHDMIHLEGPAASQSYRWTYRFLGFANSERLASLLR